MASWFTDLAKRGEAFLESVDQTAAKTAAEPDVVLRTARLVLGAENQEEQTDFTDENGFENETETHTTAEDTSFSLTATVLSDGAPSVQDELKDAFLNHVNGKAESTPAAASSVQSPSPAIMKTIQVDALAQVVSPSPTSSVNPVNQSYSIINNAPGTPSSKTDTSRFSTSDATGRPTLKRATHHDPPPPPTPIDSIEKDNNHDLLQQEVRTLHDEIRSFNLRNKQLEEQLSQMSENFAETKRALQKAQTQRDQLSVQAGQLQSDKDRLIREVSRLSELLPPGEAPSTPSQTLKPGETNEDSLMSTISTLQYTSTQWMEWQAEQDRERQNFQNELRRLRNEMSRVEEESESRRQASLLALETLQQDLRRAERAQQQAVDDLSSYQARAAKALQDKDRLCKELQEELAKFQPSPSGALVNGDTDNASAETHWPVVVRTLRRERDEVSAELADREATLEQLRRQFTDLQRQTEAAEDNFRRKLQETETALAAERKIAHGLREELSIFTEETTNELRDLKRTLATTETQLSVKNMDIARLQSELQDALQFRGSSRGGLDQATISANNTTRPNEESSVQAAHRVASLKQAVLDKQAIIEKLTSDNAALRVRLETELSKAIQRRKQEEVLLDLVTSQQDDEEMADTLTTVTVPTLTDEEQTKTSTTWLGYHNRLVMRPAQVALQRASFLPPNNTPIPTTLTATRPASLRNTGGTPSIDRISVRIINVLRKYAAARLLIVAYLALLHFWALAVLNTCTAT